MRRAALSVTTLIAVAALAVAVAALVLVLRDDDGPPGRLSTVRSVSQYAVNEPVLVERDDFYLVRLVDPESGTPFVRALYRIVPHVYFGLREGCRVTWEPDQSWEKDGETYAGIFSEPCGGSKFAVDGTRLYGPAVRNLDQFLAYINFESDDAVVDTRVLMCEERPSTTCMRTLASR